MDEKVTLAVSGKFHAFHLASQYASMNRLSALYSVHRTVKPPKNLKPEQYHNRLDLALGVYLSAHLPFLKMTHLFLSATFRQLWIVSQ